MFYPDILTAGLESAVLYRRGCTEQRVRGGILLLDEDLLPQAAPLYIGSWKDLPETLPAGSCLFCSEGADYVGDYDMLCPSCRDLILFDLRSTKLYNEVSTRYRQYILWRAQLDHSQDLDEMTRLASTASGYPVAIVDSFFQTMAIHAVTEPNSSVFHALIEEKALSQSTAEFMLSSERSSHYANKLLFTFEEQLVEDYLIRYDNRSIARILVEQVPGVDPVLAQHYIDDFLRAARPLVQSNDDLKKMSMNAISTLIADLIDLRVTDPEELERRRKLVPDMVKGKVYHPIVVRFENPGADIPYNYFTGQLERVFRRCSVSSYNGGLVVIAAKKQFDAELEFDRELLMNLLERYDAYIGIGECTLFLSSLRPIYIQTSAAIRLGRTFSEDPSQRIFFFADYRMHFFADLVVEAAVRQHEFWNLSYLCTPGVIAILRYDKKYGKDLFQTLKCYLETSCNATLCAKKMNVHRNTINYRLELITNLLGHSLDDYQYRQIVEFSILILQYQVQYLHCDPLATGGKLAMDMDWGSYRSFTERP